MINKWTQINNGQLKSDWMEWDGCRSKQCSSCYQYRSLSMQRPRRATSAPRPSQSKISQQVDWHPLEKLAPQAVAYVANRIYWTWVSHYCVCKIYAAELKKNIQVRSQQTKQYILRTKFMVKRRRNKNSLKMFQFVTYIFPIVFSKTTKCTA